MGMIASSMRETMRESFQKQQDFMLETQQMQLGRQMAMQQIMGQKQMAMQMARQREMFQWVAAFTGTVSVFCLLGAMRTKSPKPLAPLLPLGFITGYQYDLAHGNKILRIRSDAEYLLNETNAIGFPNGDLSIQQVDDYREKK